VVVDVVTDNAASDLVWRGTTSGEPLAVAGTPGPYVPSMTREQHSAQLMRDAPDVGGRWGPCFGTLPGADQRRRIRRAAEGVAALGLPEECTV